MWRWRKAASVAVKYILGVLCLFNSLMRELVELQYFLTNPLLLDDSALRNLLGGIRKTHYEDGMRISLNDNLGRRALP